MARGGTEWWRWSYKRTTVLICCLNLVAALYVLRSLSTSLSSDFKYTGDQIKKVEESSRARRDLESAGLVRLAKELREEFSGKKKRLELSQPMKQMLTNEILERLKAVEDVANVTAQHDALELWRMGKLKEFERVKLSSSPNSSISPEEASIEMLEKALESDWFILLEEIGLWMPVDVTNKEVNDKPDNMQELEEEEIIAGQPLPRECHAEPNTDYDGAAVRWGLTHHKETAAQCCQACFDQAKRAKAGEAKCNIWVYCPLESGCYSPDIYEHRHQECWLKQAKTPRLNFKNQYSESYRSSHPKAPVVVPWVSGVLSA